ncbi:MAG: hypothetical protein ACR2P4_08310 [Gammaproteobacteria bacterium]
MRDSQGGALSRFALCYNISPLQGFKFAELKYEVRQVVLRKGARAAV